jgi:beta-barrel assembly-enhancing protease
MNATYFNGQSSKPYPVKVAKTFNGWQIDSINPEDKINTVWIQEDISVLSFSTGDKVMLSYGGFPPQRLELLRQGSEEILQSVLHQESVVSGAYQKITRMNPLKLVVSSFLILAGVIYLYLMHISPFVGEKAVVLVPAEIEIKVGDISFKQMNELFDIDAEKSKKLMEFYNEVGFESSYPVEISYIDNSIVNAFALPGGHIMLFDGIVDLTDSWEELAAVLAHELAHINQRHSFKQMARAASSYLILSVLTGDVAGASTVILEQANQIYAMSNSRVHEKEADVVGLQYLKNSKINPSAMQSLFQKMMDEEALPDNISDKMEFLSSHPLSKNRVDYIYQLICDDSSFKYETTSMPRAEQLWLELKGLCED